MLNPILVQSTPHQKIEKSSASRVPIADISERCPFFSIHLKQHNLVENSVALAARRYKKKYRPAHRFTSGRRTHRLLPTHDRPRQTPPAWGADASLGSSKLVVFCGPFRGYHGVEVRWRPNRKSQKWLAFCVIQLSLTFFDGSGRLRCIRLYITSFVTQSSPLIR